MLYRNIQKLIIFIIVLCILLPIFIHIIYIIPAFSKFFISTWESRDLLLYISQIISSICTLLLGYINIKLVNENNMKNDEKFEKSLEPIINVMYGSYSGGDKKSIGIRFCNVSKNIALNIKIVNYIVNNFKTGESKIITKNEIVLPCVEPIYTREYVLDSIENFNNDSKLEINFEYDDVNEKKFYGKFFVVYDNERVKFVNV